MTTKHTSEGLRDYLAGLVTEYLLHTDVWNAEMADYVMALTEWHATVTRYLYGDDVDVTDALEFFGREP